MMSRVLPAAVGAALSGCFYVAPIAEREPPTEFECSDVTCTIDIEISPSEAQSCQNPTPEMQDCANGTGSCVIRAVHILPGNTCCMIDEPLGPGMTEQDTEEYQCCHDDNDMGLPDPDSFEDVFNDFVNELQGNCFDLAVDADAAVVSCDHAPHPPADIGAWTKECDWEDVENARIYEGAPALEFNATKSTIHIQGPGGQVATASVSGSVILAEKPMRAVFGFLHADDFELAGASYSGVDAVLNGDILVAGQSGLLLVGPGEPWAAQLSAKVAGEDRAWRASSTPRTLKFKMFQRSRDRDRGPLPGDTDGMIDLEAGVFELHVVENSLGWTTTLHAEGAVIAQSDSP